VHLAVFFIVAAVAVGSALGLVVKRNPIHGALFLVVNLGSIAVLYLTLHAQFLAAAQVIVYAGAIMVLFVFAIMVLIPGKEETGPDPLRPVRLIALPVGAFLLLEIVLVVVSRPSGPAAASPVAGGVAAIGRALFTDYLFPFELTSVLLLAALVGVLALAKRRPAAASAESGRAGAGAAPEVTPIGPGEKEMARR
jgi:NADH-quinone oxidoreductase subunit J